jgi:hypothetical protein
MIDDRPSIANNAIIFAKRLGRVTRPSQMMAERDGHMALSAKGRDQ